MCSRNVLLELRGRNMSQILSESRAELSRGRRLRRYASVAILSVGLASAGVSAASAQEDGGLLANACTACHGVDGRSETAIPTIAGLDPVIFAQLMTGFADDTLMVTIMNRIAKAYTAEQILLLANYFAAR